MVRVRRGDVDNIHLRVGNKSGIGTVCTSRMAREEGKEVACSRQAGGGGGGDKSVSDVGNITGARGCKKVFGEFAGDPTGGW